MPSSVVEDFRDGMTDLIFNGNIRQAEIIDNFDITREGKIRCRYGSRLKDSSEQLDNESRVGLFYNINDILFAQSLNKLYYDEGSGLSELSGPSSGDLFSSMTSTTYASIARWNDHLIITNDQLESPQKVYQDSDGDWQLRTAGLPQLASDPTITPDVDDSKNYKYKFLYFYEYTVGDLTFNDFGSTRLVEVTNAGDFSAIAHYNNVTNIPVLSGGNYDTSNVRVYVYRTIHNGTSYYYVGNVQNGTTTFQDTVTDTALQSNEPLYTEGGVVENDPPPLSKYVVSANDIMWYLNIKEDGIEYNYRVRQSIKSDPDSCPESFFTDLDDEIRGGGSVGIKPIVMTKSKIYRLDGYVDFTGRGFTEAVVIHDTAGCSNHNSVVQTANGLYWAGNDGFYYTDGYNVSNISKHLPDTFKTFTDSELKRKKIQSAYSPKDDIVYWSVCTELESNKIFLLFENHIHQSVSGGIEGSFTTYSGDAYFTPTALTVLDDELIRGDDRGYIYVHKSNSYNDPTIQADSLPASYNRKTITYQWRHIAIDFGDPMNTKWVSKINVGFQNNSNVHVQLNSYDDGNLTPGVLKEITYLDDMTWGSPDWIWNSADHIWNENKMFSKTRWMVKGHLRCRYKQMEITNALTNIDWSDQKCTADLTGATGKFTLTDTDMNWPSICEEYEIRYSTDGGTTYSDWYEIVDRESSTVIDTDLSTSDESGVKWEIRGYAKYERPHINNIIFELADLSDKTKGGYYQSSDASGNS